MKREYDSEIHIMVDMETLGTGVYPAILQLSAVQFNPVTGKTFEEFNQYITLESCIVNKLEIDSNTLKWWLSQDRILMENTLCNLQAIEIKDALYNFTDFLNYIEGDGTMWGKGPSFDQGKLSNVFSKVAGKGSTPWKYYNEKCVRTMVGLVPEVKGLYFQGEPHNGIDDCKHQIKQVNHAINRLIS